MTFAVITCLSEARRGRPLTQTRPYGLIPLANEPLILHQARALRGDVDELVILIGKRRGGDGPHGREDRELDRELLAPLLSGWTHRFIDEEDWEGAAAALSSASLILPGDLLPLAPLDASILSARRSGASRDGRGPVLLAVAEGSEEASALQSLLAALGSAAPRLDRVETDALRVDYPWEVLNANSRLLRAMEGKRDPSAIVDDRACITGDVTIGARTRILPFTRIEGPVAIGADCVIGPFAHIRPETSIGDGCTIGKSELFDSVIMKGCVSKHHAYIGHSVLCEDVNVGAMSVTADYRHDAAEHVTAVDGDRVGTGRRKLGAFIGDHARLGISTSFYPGRKLSANATTLPGEIITGDR